jgi:hypothetical protein
MKDVSKDTLNTGNYQKFSNSLILDYSCTLLFGAAVLLFFGLAYPHHLHYQEQYQLFLFDATYAWEVIRQPGGFADLLGRFCTQFFLYAWVGAFIIALLLSAVQLLTLRLLNGHLSMVNDQWSIFNGLSFVPSFLLWLFLLDENALLGGVWAVLLTLLTACVIVKLTNGRMRYVLLIIAIPVLYILVGPVCFPIPVDSLWLSAHYYRYPTVFPWLLWGASISVFVIVGFVLLIRHRLKPLSPSLLTSSLLLSFLLVAVVMGSLVWKNANIKAEKVMQYDFMATHQQWNRILETVNKEKPNNQIGVTVQNLALAMHGMLLDHMFEYNQNGIAGLLPDVKEDATSPIPTAEAFYQLGMVNVAQRTVFEAQEAILDFQKSGRCYKRLAQTNLINGQYEVARKYLSALQKTLFYRDWANETLPLLGNEEAIASHPEYGRLRQMAYKDDSYFSDHVTPEMLESLYYTNTDNRLAYQYLLAYYMLTGDRERYNQFMSRKQ